MGEQSAARATSFAAFGSTPVATLNRVELPDRTVATPRVPLPRTPLRTVVHVAPVDADGLRSVQVITTMWGITLAGLLPFYPTLQSAGREWWIWVCSAGLGIGLLGIDHLRRRRDSGHETGPGTSPGTSTGRRRAL